MPTYRIRPDHALVSSGVRYDAGQTLDLPRHVAEDMAVRADVEEVDAAGTPVVRGPFDDLAGFKAHERVSMLTDRLAAARAVVTSLEAQVAHEEQQLVEAVQAMVDARKPRPSVASPGKSAAKLPAPDKKQE